MESTTAVVGLCVLCGQSIPVQKYGPRRRKYCSNNCRQKQYRIDEKTRNATQSAPTVLKTRNAPPDGRYRAVNIHILDPSEVGLDPRFDWELAFNLAEEFIRPVQWIKRGILACREAGVSPQYFIDRYLHKKPVPMNRHVDLCFRKILDEAQL